MTVPFKPDQPTVTVPETERKCACCDYREPVAGLTSFTCHMDGEPLYCDICLATRINLSKTSKDHELLSAVAIVGNIIRNDLRKYFRMLSQ